MTLTITLLSMGRKKIEQLFVSAQYHYYEGNFQGIHLMKPSSSSVTTEVRFRTPSPKEVAMSSK